MSNNITMPLKTIRVKQNSQEFLLGVFSIEDILKFTRYTEYTILGFDEENDNRPITRGEVQRKLNSSKVEEIADFLIHDPQAIFPTNLVISIPNHVIEEIDENEDSGEVIIHLSDVVFEEIQKIDNRRSGDIYLSIIDGQHRVKGIETAIKRLEAKLKVAHDMIRSGSDKFIKEVQENSILLSQLKSIELAVSFFIDPVLEYQAMIFSTINRTQTKVPQDLVYSLFGLTKDDSPQKTALNIVNTLNGRLNSPLYKRIRLAGATTKAGKSFYKEGNPVLSQAMVVKSILFLICKNNRDAEIERHKPRKYFLLNPNKDLPFRIYFGRDEDEKMIRILFSFFSAVRKAFIINENEYYWDFQDPGNRKPTNILQTTIGYQALISILEKLLVEIPEESKDKVETYTPYLERVKGIDFEDKQKRYPFTSKSRTLFYNDLGFEIWGKDFIPRKVPGEIS